MPPESPRTRCPKCEAVCVRLDMKVRSEGNRSRAQAVQPRGGLLAPGPVFFCRVHGVFTTTSPEAPETRAERRARLHEALLEVAEDLVPKGT